MKRRIICMLLGIVLLFQFLPSVALAEELIGGTGTTLSTMEVSNEPTYMFDTELADGNQETGNSNEPTYMFDTELAGGNQETSNSNEPIYMLDTELADGNQETGNSNEPIYLFDTELANGNAEMNISLMDSDPVAETKPAFRFEFDKLGYQPGDSAVITVYADVPADVTLTSLDIYSLNVNDKDLGRYVENQGFTLNTDLTWPEDMKESSYGISAYGLTFAEGTYKIGSFKLGISLDMPIGSYTLYVGGSCGWKYNETDDSESLYKYKPVLSVTFPDGQFYTLPTLYGGKMNESDDEEPLFAIDSWQENETQPRTKWSSSARTDLTYAVYQTPESPAAISLGLKSSVTGESYKNTVIEWYQTETEDITDAEPVYTDEIDLEGKPTDLTELTRRLNLSYEFNGTAGQTRYITVVVTNNFNGTPSTLSATAGVKLVTVEDNDALYSVSSDKIAYYYGSEESMTIPHINDTLGQMGRGYDYSSNYWPLTPKRVKVSEGIKTIGAKAFYNWAALTSIDIPESVTSIVTDAFCGAGRQGGKLSLTFNNNEPGGSFAADAVDLNKLNSLTIYCYKDSGAHSWAKELQLISSEKVKIRFLDDQGARFLKVLITEKENGTPLGNESFEKVEWFQGDSEEPIQGQTGMTLSLTPEDTVDAENTYTCRVSFKKETRNLYLVSAYQDFVFSNEDPLELSLKLRAALRYRGTVNSSQSGWISKCEYTVSQPAEDGGTVATTENITTYNRTNGSFEFEAPALNTSLTLSGYGMKLLLRDIQMRSPNDEGIIDLGELTLNNTNFDWGYRGKVSDASALKMALQEGADGFYLLKKSTGEKYHNISIRVDNDGTYFIYLRNDADTVFQVGDEVEICYEPSNIWARYIFEENGSLTISRSYMGLPQVTKNPVFTMKGSFVRTEYIKELAAIGVKLFMFDAEGKKVDIQNETTYLDEGRYTLIALSENVRINTIDSLDALEFLGLPKWSYAKQEYDIENGKRYTFKKFVPYMSLDNYLSITLEADPTGVINGLVPVYLKCKVNDNADTLIGNTLTFEISSQSWSLPELPLQKVNGHYAFLKGGGTVTENVYTHTGSVTGYEVLSVALPVFAEEFVICLYAKPEGATLYAKAVASYNSSVGASVKLPSRSVSITAPAKITNSCEGSIALRIIYDKALYARIYVDDQQQGERKRIDSGSRDSSSIAYTLPKYSDGVSRHTVRVTLENYDETVLWASDTYGILRTDESLPEPETMTIRQDLMYTGANNYTVDFKNGKLPSLSLTTYPSHFNADQTINKTLTYDYKLKMSNSDMVEDNLIMLTVWCGKDRDDPIKKYVTLNYNSETGTYDGTLELAAGTYGVGDLPYGFDLNYGYELGETVTPSVKQLEDQWKARKEALTPDDEAIEFSPEDRVDMEELTYLLESDLLVKEGDEALTEAEKEYVLQIAQLNNQIYDAYKDMEDSLAEAIQSIVGDVDEDGEMIDPLAGLGIISETVPYDEEYLTELGFERIEMDGHEIWQLSDGLKLCYIYDPETELMLQINEPGSSSPTRRTRTLRSSGNYQDNEHMSDEVKKNIAEGHKGMDEAAFVYQTCMRVVQVAARIIWDNLEYIRNKMVKLCELEEAASAIEIEKLNNRLTKNQYLVKGAFISADDPKKLAEHIKALQEYISELESVATELRPIKITPDWVTNFRNNPMTKKFTFAAGMLSVFNDIFTIAETYEYCENKIKSLEGEIDLAERYWEATSRWANEMLSIGNTEASAQLWDCQKNVGKLWIEASDAIEWCGYFAKSKMATSCVSIVSTIVGFLPVIQGTVAYNLIDITVWTAGNVNEIVCRIGIEVNQGNVDDLWPKVTKYCVELPTYDNSGSDAGNEALGRPVGTSSSSTSYSPSEEGPVILPLPEPDVNMSEYEPGDQIPGFSDPDALFTPAVPQNPDEENTLPAPGEDTGGSDEGDTGGSGDSGDTGGSDGSGDTGGSGGSGGTGGSGMPARDKPYYETPPKPVIDPAGYVYEAVASNRIEGAKVTAYYRDGSGSAAKWDAEEYEQVNPLTTDSEGAFSWFTPPGNWLVRAVKTGYEDADSSGDPAAVNGWLPVPPPQMDVNIGMKSNAAPTVKSCTAAADRVRVVFSQYMDIAQIIDDEVVTVTQDGADIPVTIAFEDEEESPTQAGTFYGKVMKLTQQGGQSFSGSVTVKIAASAKNYAGIQLGTDYTSGTLTVKQLVGSIEHSYPNRFVTSVGVSGDLAVRILDTTGKPMSGVAVTAKQETGGTMRLSERAVSDANGRAVFAFRGVSSGYDKIIFTADTVSAEMNTRVAPIGTVAPAKPTANLGDYSVVAKGTQLVITAQQGAAIRYTTDDTCPCTDAALTYNGPITLTESGFYRIAAWTKEGGYSERLNLHITVEEQSGGSSGSGGGGGAGGSVSYTISVEKTENGSVSVSSKKASKGDTVTITTMPDEGYMLETLNALDKNGNEIALDIVKLGEKYTFKMPSGEVSVKAAFVENNSARNYFLDVTSKDYFYNAVLWAAENGITSGTDPLHFSPNAPCTRAQIVTFLWRAAGSPEAKSMSSFSDVKNDSYYAKAVAWAVENGITSGTGNGKFSPDAICTRAQAVTFLYRASGSPAVSGSTEFSDVADSAYYADAVKWATAEGITKGIGGGLFGSDDNCTRAQIVTFLWRAMVK